MAIIRNRNGRNKRDRMGFVLYMVYILVLIVWVVVIFKLFYIQWFWSPDERIYDALTPKITKEEFVPERGDILDCEGRKLALTLPRYQLCVDCTVQKKAHRQRADSKYKKDKKAADEMFRRLENDWKKEMRETCREVSVIVTGKRSDDLYNRICAGREEDVQYIRIGKPVDRNAYNAVMNLDLHKKKGKNYTGLYFESEYTRRYPYGTLARRTIGFVRSNNIKDTKNNHIGIEGKFDYELHGKTGVGYVRKTDNGKIRDNDSIYVEAVDGNDVRLTINIDYQEIADRALREQVEGRNDIKGVTLALMEVRTGAIKAMVNLVRDPQTGVYEESQNLVVGRRNEPGSVFKTVTLMSVLSDGCIKSLDEMIPVGDGTVEGTNIKDQYIKDDYVAKGKDAISVIDGFKISSNYVFAKLAIDNYYDDPEQFLDNIRSYKLGAAFDFDLEGLAEPGLPELAKKGRHRDKMNPNDLGRLGFGYVSELTPLHVLTFYNAIANKGRMMKPYLVEAIERNGETVKKMGPSVLNSGICSKAVADTLNRALLAVTSDGTAKWSLRGCYCNVAGKTGTSFGVVPGGGYQTEDRRKYYQSTFVGYFPAEKPEYTIISTLYSELSLTDSSLQGGGIPARAVKTTINGIFNIDPAFREVLYKAD